jgi:dihydroorotate dehydrogenase (fumarate)
MATLSTHYLGLELPNPLIVGSSGLTNSIKQIKEAASAGAGAIVLKSIFEEQIRMETNKFMDKEHEKMGPFKKGYEDVLSTREYDYAEAQEYISNFAREHTLGNYLKFVEEAKKSVNIPVIASINCVSAYDWHYFARRIQSAGADALELNIYILPSDPSHSSLENEKIFFSVAEAVLKQVNIPVAIKLSYYFSGLSKTLIELSKTGIKGLVMFNRPFHPDIDIQSLEINSNHLLSEPSEYAHTLRWIALLYGRVGCDLIASTGIHDHESVIKQLLAGATAVQMASALYKYGFKHITEVLKGIEGWMDQKGFKTTDDFRGMLSQQKLDNPAAFERVQFMKLYSQIT